MIRVNRPEIELLPSLRLYREDLEKLFSIFKENCQHVILADDEYAYESVEEMAKNTARRKALHLRGVVPHAELLVKGARATKLRIQRSSLWIMEPNEKSRLLFLEARDLLLSRRWRFKEIASIAAMILGGSAALSSAILRAIIREHLAHGEINAEVVGLLGLLVLSLGMYIYIERTSYITIESRNKTQSFWERNQDKILLAVFSGGIGVAGTLLVKWLTK